MSNGAMTSRAAPNAGEILSQADLLQRRLGENLRDRLVDDIYSNAASIAGKNVSSAAGKGRTWDQTLDRILTSRLFGLPLMALGLAVVFWVTVAGANYPSQMLATGLFWIEEQAAALFNSIGMPWWITGFIWHGVYKGLAWVISVMLPPMATG